MTEESKKLVSKAARKSLKAIKKCKFTQLF